MLVFGIDVPLVEVIFTFAIIILILLIESLIIIVLLLKQSHKSKQIGEAVEKLSEAILLIKRSEIEELDKLSRR
jgi:preprotein translocase subunit SecG